MWENKGLLLTAAGLGILAWITRKLPAPVKGRLSSRWGSRVHPITNIVTFHKGVDIACPVGTPVYVPQGGKVSGIYSTAAGGLTMLVTHAGGWRTGYAHLSAVKVRPGQRVTAGQRIALSGNSGLSTGPHLHFSATLHGKSQDPARRYSL